MRPPFRTITGSVVAGLLLAASGCIVKQSPQGAAPEQMQRPEPSFVTDGPGCADARQRAARDPRSRDIYPPAPKTLFVPPPSSQPLNGATLIVTLRVDTAGRAVPSSAKVVRDDNGILIPGYKGDVTGAAERLTFRPAVLAGCAVEGTATLLFKTG